MHNLFKKRVPAVSKRFPRFYYDEKKIHAVSKRLFFMKKGSRGFIFDGKVHAVSKRFMWFYFWKNS